MVNMQIERWGREIQSWGQGHQIQIWAGGLRNTNTRWKRAENKHLILAHYLF